jgi:putative 4-mercaptohistidine N1-methyltranferase
MTQPGYEADEVLAQYLLLHYGSPEDTLPFRQGPKSALDFPQRCVTETVEIARVPPQARALDLGCAVGRASFELARFCADVVGIDSSRRFIETAQRLQRGEAVDYTIPEQGELHKHLRAQVPPDIDRTRLQFELGDALALRDDLGTFDVVLMANLLCRLERPRACLAQLPALVRPGGQVVITTPSTWRQIYTPREQWLGGFDQDGKAVRTLDGLKESLAADFNLLKRLDLPLLIREHARKYEYIVAEATVWQRR